MSRLSANLKSLITAPHAHPDTVPASSTIRAVYERIARSAADHGVGLPAWLTLSTAATMTMNSPESMWVLHELAAVSAGRPHGFDAVTAAELMREVGLKCISFNGIPRTINILGAFHAGLTRDIASQLNSKPASDRSATAENIVQLRSRGEDLWRSIYHPFSEKLVNKLAQSHPNLPRVILQYHYGGLLSDPPATSTHSSNVVGRVLTSVVAVACLRAQTGVAPQVTSHVFGLRKAYEDESAEAEAAVEGGKWLASDEGSIWLLECVDRIVASISGEQGATTFAPGFRAKL